ncbi:hypothetical protein N7523_006829 [Penicillium sp. IBT 18751x]|nr:hypothetical protein N7523_006829 [Penicillium sp. IBT 18751x]
MFRAKQAKEPRRSISIAQAGADSNKLLDSVEGRAQGSVDLGYSLLPGSNTFVGLQEILGDEDFQNITVRHNDAPQFMLPKKNIEELLAKLPPRPVIAALVDFFFDSVNWHYFILERFYFDSLLSRWPPAEGTEAVSHLTLAELCMEMRYFPALLFQVIALSLLFAPTDWDVVANLPVGGVTASHMYSDLGDELLSQLGRPGLALTAVQADFLRSSWLKNCGRGIESWYTVGSAIRQAQELRLHQQKEIQQANGNNVGKTLSLFWYEENKKRLWVNLFVWDSFMAMILGRPRMINLDDCDAKPPMNCNIPRDPSTAIPMTVRPEDSNSPVTISAVLLKYELACKVHKMRATKADSPRLDDYNIVQKLHEEIMLLKNEVPAFLRLKNTDTTWDIEHPYLPQLRQEFQVMLNLIVMALHRSHVISNGESRKAALQAALQTLDCQQQFFAQAEKNQYHLFGLAFYTVDASFLVSIIATLFPPSSPKAKHKIDQSLQQAMEDLSLMQSSNPIARSGLKIIQRCYQKIKSACESHNSTSEPRSASFSNPGDGLHNLIHDLGLQSFDLSTDSNPESSQVNTISGPSSPDLFSQSIPDVFDQGYWLDQLNMIHPSISDQDPGFLWENFYFD